MSQPPPTPLKFDEEIQKLAQEARQESQQQEKKVRWLGPKRRGVSTVIKAGVALIALELVTLAIFYTNHQQQVTTKAKPLKIATRQDCAGEVYRTFWKVVRFKKEHGHPPTSLAELVGEMGSRLPADPVTGRPLEYTTNGDDFSVRCPGGKTRAAAASAPASASASAAAPAAGAAPQAETAGTGDSGGTSVAPESGEPAPAGDGS